MRVIQNKYVHMFNKIVLLLKKKKKKDREESRWKEKVQWV